MISYTTQSKLAMLYSQPYFDQVPESTTRLLSQDMVLRAYASGQSLFLQGDECAGLYIIESGSVKLYRTSHSGRDIIIRIASQGESFNEVPVFDGGRNPVNAMALTACKIWIVPTYAIQYQLQFCPQLAQSVIKALSQNTRTLVDKVVGFSFQNVTTRLAKLLLDLPPEALSGPDRLTQDDLAACLGTVREVVARALRHLQSQEAIHLRRGHITVLDQYLLQQIIRENDEA